jgi:hypothetical protein
MIFIHFTGIAAESAAVGPLSAQAIDNAPIRITYAVCAPIMTVNARRA